MALKSIINKVMMAFVIVAREEVMETAPVFVAMEQAHRGDVDVRIAMAQSLIGVSIVREQAGINYFDTSNTSKFIGCILISYG